MIDIKRRYFLKDVMLIIVNDSQEHVSIQDVNDLLLLVVSQRLGAALHIANKSLSDLKRCNSGKLDLVSDIEYPA